MKFNLRNTMLAVFTATFVLLGTGCESLREPGFAPEPLQEYYGGGGGNN